MRQTEYDSDDIYTVLDDALGLVYNKLGYMST